MRIIIDNVPELDQSQQMAILRTLGNKCYELGLGVVMVFTEQPEVGP